MWDGEDEMNNGGSEPTPKQRYALKTFPTYSIRNRIPFNRLMNWIQSKVPEIPIHNFTSDWNDGKAVGALVDAVAPGLCPDWQVSIVWIVLRKSYI